VYGVGFRSCVVGFSFGFTVWGSGLGLSVQGLMFGFKILRAEVGRFRVCRTTSRVF